MKIIYPDRSEGFLSTFPFCVSSYFLLSTCISHGGHVLENFASVCVFNLLLVLCLKRLQDWNSEARGGGTSPLFFVFFFFFFL